jgi:hypothetical protein
MGIYGARSQRKHELTANRQRFHDGKYDEDA